MEREFAPIVQPPGDLDDADDWLGRPSERSVLRVPYPGAPAFPEHAVSRGAMDAQAADSVEEHRATLDPNAPSHRSAAGGTPADNNGPSYEGDPGTPVLAAPPPEEQSSSGAKGEKLSEQDEDGEPKGAGSAEPAPADAQGEGDEVTDGMDTPADEQRATIPDDPDDAPQEVDASPTAGSGEATSGEEDDSDVDGPLPPDPIAADMDSPAAGSIEEARATIPSSGTGDEETDEDLDDASESEGVDVQAKNADGGAPASRSHATALAGVSGEGQPLPHLDTVQRSFVGHDLGGVRAHIGGRAAEAAHELGATAYATGNHVAFAEPPDLYTAAHEAAHVVQQRAGVQLKGGFGETGDAYERNADDIADRVVRGESARDLLGAPIHQRRSLQHATNAPAVQRQQAGPGSNRQQPSVTDDDIAIATSLTTGIANGVVPNNKKQQEHALLGVTNPERLLDDDPALKAQLTAIATRRSRRFRNRYRRAAEHRNVIRGGTVAAGVLADEANLRRQLRQVASGSAEHRLAGTVRRQLAGSNSGAGASGTGGNLIQSIVNTANRVGEVTRTARAQLIAEEEKRLRGKFLLWAGRILHTRHPGRPAMNALRKAERTLVQRLRRLGKSAPVIQMQVWQLRHQHAARFRPKLARIKKRFIVAARNEQRFRFEAQPGTRSHSRIRPPRNDARGITTVGATGGVVTGSPNLRVANAAVDFARALRSKWRGRITIDTYAGHSLGAYSLDIQPWVRRDSRGFYDPEQVKRLFAAIEQAATIARVRWRALYGDFEVAKHANQRFRSRARKVGFQWEHGPAPFVLHIHVDVVPR